MTRLTGLGAKACITCLAVETQQQHTNTRMCCAPTNCRALRRLSAQLAVLWQARILPSAAVRPLPTPPLLVRQEPRRRLPCSLKRC